MPEARLIRQCAPTLAGLKSGSLFLYPCPFSPSLRATLLGWNRLLIPNGLRILPLRADHRGTLLYLYRPKFLSADLTAPTALCLLARCGYSVGDPNRCLVQLIRRLQKPDFFPHEIGLFLGYPPEDVQGFMEHRGRHFKCAGLWKVYGDADAAQETFRQYRLCTAFYCARWAAGSRLDQLIADI